MAVTWCFFDGSSGFLRRHPWPKGMMGSLTLFGVFGLSAMMGLLCARRPQARASCSHSPAHACLLRFTAFCRAP